MTLGRFDVHFAVSTLGRYSAAPRQGHVKAMLRVFGYLKYHMKRQILCNTEEPEFDKAKMVKHYWSELYPDAKEEYLPDMPTPKGKSLKITTYFDADHAHDLETRRLVTGVVILLNKTPIQWYSKRQATVESSTYGSEMVAARITTELTMAMRYRLRMLGVPIEGPVTMLGDNLSVVTNCTVSISTLKKKHNAIAYHRVREAVAAGVINLVHVPTQDNLADIMTKLLGPQQHYPLMS